MKMFSLEVLTNACTRTNFLMHTCISGNCLLDGISGNCLLDGKFKTFIYISISTGTV